VLVDKGTTAVRFQFQLYWSPTRKDRLPTRPRQSVEWSFSTPLRTHIHPRVTTADMPQPGLDPNGKYLYFLASTDDGPSRPHRLSSLDAPRPMRLRAVLARTASRPFPGKRRRKIKDEKQDDKKTSRRSPPTTRRRRQVQRQDESKPGDKDKNASKDDKTKRRTSRQVPSISTHRTACLSFSLSCRL